MPPSGATAMRYPSLPPDDPEVADRELPPTAVLYERHATLVWRALARLGVTEADREDLLQEVFVIAHRMRAEYRGSGANSSWLYGIAIRVASRHHRKCKVRSKADLTQVPGPSAPSTPEEDATTRQQASLLQRALAALPPKRMAVFVMFELEGLSCDEISAVLEIPVGTVYSRLHSARDEFRSAWDALSGESPSPPRNATPRPMHSTLPLPTRPRQPRADAPDDTLDDTHNKVKP